jgi:hypothetical protein
MASLYQRGKKVCDVSSVSVVPGQRKLERIGNQVVPGRKDVDSVTFTCPEPILPDPTYELRLDDGTVLSIAIEHTSGTQGGTNVRALIQP